MHTFEELIERLSGNEHVNAIALVGSASENNLNPTSDYDLLIVLNAPPLLLTSGVSTIEGRMLDLLFVTTEDIDDLLAAQDSEITIEGIPGTVARWMQTAQVRFDRSGRLTRLKCKVHDGFVLKQMDEAEIRSRIDKASYNLAHTKRMIESDDPVYLSAIDLRMLYQLDDLMLDYFRVRRLAWSGEKDAIRYWQSHDADYFELFSRCLQETDRRPRVDLYEQLANATMAPAGALWESGATTFRLSPDSAMTEENIRAAKDFWESLLS